MLDRHLRFLTEQEHFERNQIGWRLQQCPPADTHVRAIMVARMRQLERLARFRINRWSRLLDNL